MNNSNATIKRDYASIHVHSEYSNIKVIDSINRYDKSIDYAWDIGLSSVAMTEHDCLSGSIKYIKAFKKKIEKEWNKLNPDRSEDKPSWGEMARELDFKPILGNEIYLSEEGLSKETQSGGHFWHLILLAKDAEGFKQIKQLSTAAWKRAWFKSILRTPTYPSDLFEFVKGGHLIASTACLGGYTAWCWKQSQFEGMFLEEENNANYYLMKLDNHLAAMTSLFGEGNFFIELQPNEGEYGKEQNDYNQFMINRYWGKYPFIFSTDAHYKSPNERSIHKAFLNSKSSSDREVDSFYRYAFIMSQQEVRNLMPYLSDEQFGEMAANTKKILDMVECYELTQPKVIAEVEYEFYDKYQEDLDVFSEVNQDNYPVFYQYINSSNRADKYLAELIAHGFIEKVEDSWDLQVYYDRLEEELSIIKEVGDKIGQSMSNYFITISKMVDLMWEAGSLVGPSRGSAGASLILYLTGTTQMNPIKNDLPYMWRFMHPSRPDFPDVDIDSESDKRAAVFNKVRDYFRSIGGDVINVCTFGTEGTKSAIKTAGRGLNIDDDVVNYLTSLVPNERGFDWSLSECYFGNEEKDRKSIKAFKQEMDKYPKLWELAQSIEGLVTRLGVHASGVICVNGDFVEHGSYMKTNKEQIVTCFDLHDQEECGVLKYDMLTVSALDRIHQTINYMLEDGVMEWQGSLRKTYDKYLDPNKLKVDDLKMWDMAANGEIRSLFQFDTTVGSQSIKAIHPTNLKQLAISNSVMRLMAEGGEEQPLDKYVRFKTAPVLWYDEMRNYGLTSEEISIVEKYLKAKDGIADSQEIVMLLSMDPQISNFTMEEANKLRKTIAKKKFDDIEKVHKLYIEKGLAAGTSLNLLNYIWDAQFKMSFGYSFSEVHTTGYSLIAIQEMNLAYYYPIIYWNTACLSVDSSAINSQDFYRLIEEEIIDADDNDVEGKKVSNKMDYAKIASALDSFRGSCNIKTPDINISKLGFTPDVKNNTIIYGLKGISRITDPSIEEIVRNRPFSSFEDFLNRTSSQILTKDKIINLIKCGAFNNIENKTTKEILKDFIWQRCNPKTKLTLQNANMLIDKNLLPVELDYVNNIYKLTKELRKNRDKNRIWYFIDSLTMPVDKIDEWKKIFADSKIEVSELENRPVINSDTWDSFYENKMNILRVYIKENQASLLEVLNNTLFEEEYNKYCSGDEKTWELDSLNFFFNEHPLNRTIKQLPNNIKVDRINSIIEGASDGSFFIKDKIIPKMKLYTIAGTVLDRDKTKGLVTIQAPDGVISVKCYKDLYAMFARTVVHYDENGAKIVDEDSFFEKGVHLLITGIQRGSTFIPKVYKNTGRKSIERIIVDENNNFIRFEIKEGNV